jgi:hypothetical protein
VLPNEELLPIDRWILDRATRAVDRCRQAYQQYEFHVVYHRILELCTVDLSSIYLDASKDTMYCDAPQSPERRSAQTAMYHVLRGITTAIAPILTFTADEIYEAMPGEKEASVHLAEIPRLNGTISADDAASWNRLLALRDSVMAVLEKARAAKEIGQSLEAAPCHELVAPAGRDDDVEPRGAARMRQLRRRVRPRGENRIVAEDDRGARCVLWFRPPCSCCVHDTCAAVTTGATYTASTQSAGRAARTRSENANGAPAGHPVCFERLAQRVPRFLRTECHQPRVRAVTNPADRPRIPPGRPKRVGWLWSSSPSYAVAR